MTDLLDQASSLVSLYIIAIVFWLTLVIWRERKKQDNEFMRYDTFSFCNNWCIGHFIHYFALGLVAPDLWYISLVTGILFELAEIPMGMFFSKYVDSKLVADTITNSSGLLLGCIVSKHFEYIPVTKIPGTEKLANYLISIR